MKVILPAVISPFTARSERQEYSVALYIYKREVNRPIVRSNAPG